MRMRRTRDLRGSFLVSCLLTAVFVIGLPSFATAYGIIGNKWFPLDLTRNIVVDSNGEDSVNDGDNGVTAVRNAVVVWNLLEQPLVSTTQQPDPFVSGGLTDGTSTMIFSDPFRICTGSCLAVTTTGFTTGETMVTNGRTFERYQDSDVFFSDRQAFTSEGEGDGCVTHPPKKAETYIESVAVHEVGHVLGLGHSGVNGATMYPSIGPCDNSVASLHQDDASGTFCIYKEGAGCGSAPSCTPTYVSASTSTKCFSNGKWALEITVEVVDDCGNPRAGATVRGSLTNACGQSLSGSTTTDSGGVARMRLSRKLAQTGTYAVDVTIIDPGLPWDGSGDTTSCFVTNAQTICE